MIPYYDNGIFRLTVFNKDEDLDKINVNENIGLDNNSRPNHGLPDPMMNACFVGDNNIMINVYHTLSSSMWHFFYNFVEKKMTSQPIQTIIEDCTLNFPISSHYNPIHRQVYIFFRQGESMFID